ncbi:delta(24)-sterol reductase-like [Vitis riparia]|uniref:delta(24)-sterol reductase-like n=1 Tax=Vitis riparia TaxID=96939 RepID=UPI00155A9083|nr:delta(24)-sterol reductase-like [Vitis riparia]
MRNVDYKQARHFEVYLSTFRNILGIDKERMIARCEPLVSMGQISRVSAPMNLTFVVVAEHEDLIGGLINGYGIEGSSHIYGLFSNTDVAYEIILADGQLVRATKDNEYADLFYAIPWSQGILGLLVAAEIKPIPIKEYMKLTYKPVMGNPKGLAQLCVWRGLSYAEATWEKDVDIAFAQDAIDEYKAREAAAAIQGKMVDIQRKVNRASPKKLDEEPGWLKGGQLRDCSH